MDASGEAYRLLGTPDAVSSGYLFAEQVSRHKAVCSWCTVAAVASWTSLPLVMPEARRALQALRSRR